MSGDGELALDGEQTLSNSTTSSRAEGSQTLEYGVQADV
jgi:hypothetical protein